MRLIPLRYWFQKTQAVELSEDLSKTPNRCKGEIGKVGIYYLFIRR